jgi:hypothetical protein
MTWGVETEEHDESTNNTYVSTAKAADEQEPPHQEQPQLEAEGEERLGGAHVANVATATTTTSSAAVAIAAATTTSITTTTTTTTRETTAAATTTTTTSATTSSTTSRH